MKIRALVLLIVALFATASCSNEKKVGSAIDLDKLSKKSDVLGKLKEQEKKGNNAAGFLGGKNTPAPTGAAANAAAQQAAQQQHIEEQKKASAVAFSITSSGYDPYYIRVFKGGVVSVTNRDSKARSVTADRHEFDSGSIAPGATWTYEPTSVGKFNFHDATRPYVVGTLEVLAQ